MTQLPQKNTSTFDTFIPTLCLLLLSLWAAGCDSSTSAPPYSADPLAHRFDQNQRGAESMMMGSDMETQRLKAELNAKNEEIKLLKAELEKLRDQVARGGVLPDDADGLVQWVDLKSTTVLINMGEADGLHLKDLLRVYNHSTTESGKLVEKGEVEIIKILAPHMAEARVLGQEDQPAIVVGDKLRKMNITIPTPKPIEDDPTNTPSQPPNNRIQLPPSLELPK